MSLKHFFRNTLLASIILLGCDNPFSYSPFETTVDDRYRNTTTLNLERLGQIDTLTNPVFKIALISDTHYHFDDTRDAINHINEKGEASFVIATGDITENGLKKEFEIFHNIMAHLHSPYLTVIGNHDYLANGGDVYRQMFGAFNYTFTFQGVRFIMFDNVIWESNKEADFQWLENAFSEADETEPVRHTLIFSHIPPFDGQLKEKRELFHSMLMQNDVKVSVHGHKHEYFSGELMGDGVRYVTVGSPQKRSYALLTITEDEITVEKVPF